VSEKFFVVTKILFKNAKSEANNKPHFEEILEDFFQQT